MLTGVLEAGGVPLEPAIDVYQMGLILVEMLTGHPVVNDANPIACMMALSKGDLEIAAEVRDGPVGPLIEVALAHDYKKRFADASAFSAALQAVVTDLYGPVASGQPADRLRKGQDLISTTQADRAIEPVTKVLELMHVEDNGALDPAAPPPEDLELDDTVAMDLPDDLDGLVAAFSAPATIADRPRRRSVMVFTGTLLILLGIAALILYLSVIR